MLASLIYIQQNQHHLRTDLTKFSTGQQSKFSIKTFGKVALERFLDHFQSHKLLPSYQSAYPKSLSCETTLIKLTNGILWNLDNQRVTSLTAIDLSAAFDTVDHSVLFK